ncbi:MAG: hypothetical protein ACI364_03480 [Coriobacteriales bacterium]
MARSSRVLVAVLLAVALFLAAGVVSYLYCETRYGGEHAMDMDCDAGVYDLPDGLHSRVVYDARSNAEYVVVYSDDGDVAVCPRVGEDGRPTVMPRD